MQSKPEARARPWASLAQVAAAQRGVVSVGQLRQAGIGDGAIKHKVANGELHRVFRGVYAIGHPGISQEGRWLAAVLACGEEAVLSHRSAAAHWRLVTAPGRQIEVIAPRHLEAPVGVRAHNCTLRKEAVEHRGIPITSVPRTLIDLAAVAPHLLNQAVNQAGVLRVASVEAIEQAIRANRGRRGVARLRARLPITTATSKSVLESRFLDLLARASIEPPEVGVVIKIGAQSFECDCLWRVAKLMVELDGRAFHDTEFAFERDRSRDRAFAVAGWRVVRVTWQQLERNPAEILQDLRALLRGSG